MSDKHWHECWRYASHHACAVAEVERLRAALCYYRKEIEMKMFVFTNDEQLHAVVEASLDIAAEAVKNDFADGATFIVADAERKHVASYIIEHNIGLHGDVVVSAIRADTGQETSS